MFCDYYKNSAVKTQKYYAFLMQMPSLQPPIPGAMRSLVAVDIVSVREHSRTPSTSYFAFETTWHRASFPTNGTIHLFDFKLRLIRYK